MLREEHLLHLKRYIHLQSITLPLSSPWLWAPTLAAPLILIIAVLIMENFRTKLIIEAPNEVDHMVLIQGIKWDADKLRSYLQ